MGKRVPITGFCGGFDQVGLPFNSSYGSSYSPISAAYAQNLYPEKLAQPYNGSDYALIGRPGLVDHITAVWGTTTLGSTPVRAMWAGTGRLFAVGGTHFYELAPIGGVLTDFGAMAGSTGGKKFASILQNAGSAAFTLTVLDSSSNQIYYVNAGAMVSAFNATFQEYLDGFNLAIATGASLVNSGNPNQINSSAFGDPTNWTPGPGATPNYVIITGGIGALNALATLNGMLWVFGQQGIEIWYDAGNPGFPFQRYQGATISLGCLSPASVVKFYNTVMWVGADTRGYAQVYMAKGMSPVRVSTPAIEAYMSFNMNFLTNSWALGYQEAGHTFYQLTLQALNSALLTLVYDLTENKWHVRTFGGALPICAASVPGGWASASYANMVGDYGSGKILAQSLNFPSDVGTAIAYRRDSPYVADMNKFLRHSRFELWGSLGTATPDLTYTDDYGKTYKTTPFNLGAPGANSARPADVPEFQRWYALQLGRSRARSYSVQISDSANLIRIGGALVDLSEGTS